jgi:hypothetical protein
MAMGEVGMGRRTRMQKAESGDVLHYTPGKYPFYCFMHTEAQHR